MSEPSGNVPMPTSDELARMTPQERAQLAEDQRDAVVRQAHARLVEGLAMLQTAHPDYAHMTFQDGLKAAIEAGDVHVEYPFGVG
jgi:hypothetical protein